MHSVEQGALCLNRDEMEDILFEFPDGSRGRITIMRAANHQARIAIAFPKNVRIWRPEMGELRKVAAVQTGEG